MPVTMKRRIEQTEIKKMRKKRRRRSRKTTKKSWTKQEKRNWRREQNKAEEEDEEEDEMRCWLNEKWSSDVLLWRIIIICESDGTTYRATKQSKEITSVDFDP